MSRSLQTGIHQQENNYRGYDRQNSNAIRQNRRRFRPFIQGSSQLLIESFYFGFGLYWLRSFNSLPLPTSPEDAKLVCVYHVKDLSRARTG